MVTPNAYPFAANIRAAAFLFVFFLVVAPAFVEAEGTSTGRTVLDLPDHRPRKVVLMVETSDSTLSERVGVLGESLLSAVARLRSDLLVRRVEAEGQDPEYVANLYGADAWITVQLRSGSENTGVITVIYRVGDVIRGTELSDSYHAPMVGVRDLHERTWLPVLTTVNEAVPARGTFKTLTVSGVPGTRIVVRPDAVLELDEDGHASLQLRTPGDYTIEAHKAGYRTIEKRVSLDRSTHLKLEQETAPIAFAAVSLFNAQFLELSGGWIPRRRDWYVGAFATFFQAGIALRDRLDQEDREALISVPLTHVGFTSGYRFGTDARRTRGYLGLQGFFRVSAGDDAVSLESRAPVGFAANIGFEHRTFTDGAFFAEWMPTAYPTDRRVSEDEFYDGDPGVIAIPTQVALLELSLVRLGYRHRF